MDPGPDAGTGHPTPPVRRRRARTSTGFVLIAAGGALLAACSSASPQTEPPDASVPNARVPSTETSPAPDAEAPPDAPGEELTVGDRSGDAIAVAEASEHRVESFTVTAAEAGVTYVVHAACTGEGWMRYRLTVDEHEISTSRLRCGRDVVDTAFTAEGGERVQLHLDAPADEGEGSRAEVVPAP